MKNKFTRRVVWREGHYIAVFRPGDATASLNAAKRALNTQDYDEILKAAEHDLLTFVGWLAQGRDGAVIDIRGENCGELRAGDHFIGFDKPEKAEHLAKAAVMFRELHKGTT